VEADDWAGPAGRARFAIPENHLRLRRHSTFQDEKCAHPLVIHAG
jgi:hypothetical protein